MITLNSTYSLIAKMGEALATTQPDYVVFYGKPVLRREQGTASEVKTHEIAAGAMNSTSNVTIVAATTVGTSDRYMVESLSICNRDTIPHTLYISVYDGTTERRLYNAIVIPVNGTWTFNEASESSASSTSDGTQMLLSGSTNGKGIKVVETATPGTTIHTAVTGTTETDYIELFAVNSDTTDRKLTIEWGQATAPDGNIEITIPAEDGLVQLTPDGGLPLNNALVVKAFAASANVIVIYGKVTRR